MQPKELQAQDCEELSAQPQLLQPLRHTLSSERTIHSSLRRRRVRGTESGIRGCRCCRTDRKFDCSLSVEGSKTLWADLPSGQPWSVAAVGAGESRDKDVVQMRLAVGFAQVVLSSFIAHRLLTRRKARRWRTRSSHILPDVLGTSKAAKQCPEELLSPAPSHCLSAVPNNCHR
jgi:hypothetical protein